MYSLGERRGLEAKQKESVVWSAEKFPDEADPNSVYRATGRKLPPKVLKGESP
jgi:hypothetical protein